VWWHNPTQERTWRDQPQVSDMVSELLKTNITVAQACHKHPESPSRPEGMKMVKGWEVLFEGPRFYVLRFHFRNGEWNISSAMSRLDHDPDLTESRTRGAIGPLYRWFRPPPRARCEDGLSQLADRLPEPAAIHRKHPRLNGECAGPNHSGGPETRNSGENGILPHSLVQPPQRSFDGVRRMDVELPNPGAVRRLC
jgi:hypothetical protein